MSELVRNILRFVGLVIIQILLLNNLSLFGYAHVFLFILFILFLPVTTPRWLLILLSFLIGLVIDIFMGTYGLNAAVCTLLGFLRPYVLRLVTPQYDTEDDVYKDIYARSFIETMTYAFIMSFIFCLTYFLLERFSLSGISRSLLVILASTIFTFVMIIIFRYLFIGISDSKR